MPDNGSTSFTHSAFLYDDPAQYAGFLVPFIHEGLERGESVAVAADRRRTALLREALADDAPAVRFLPADQWYVRPVRTIAGWAQMLRAAGAAGGPRHGWSARSTSTATTGRGCGSRPPSTPP